MLRIIDHPAFLYYSFLSLFFPHPLAFLSDCGWKHPDQSGSSQGRPFHSNNKPFRIDQKHLKLNHFFFSLNPFCVCSGEPPTFLSQGDSAWASITSCCFAKQWGAKGRGSEYCTVMTPLYAAPRCAGWLTRRIFHLIFLALSTNTPLHPKDCFSPCFKVVSGVNWNESYEGGSLSPYHQPWFSLDFIGPLTRGVHKPHRWR